MTNGLYRDDPTIPNEAELLRRIAPWHFVPDDNLSRLRPSSAAFDDDKDGPMSVTLADELRQEGRSLDSALAGYTDFALASITAGLARECQQGIVRDPKMNLPMLSCSGKRPIVSKRDFPGVLAGWSPRQMRKPFLHQPIHRKNQLRP